MSDIKQIPFLQAVRAACEVSVHKNTVLRWVRAGILDPNGNRHYLKANRVGGRWYCTVEDVKCFLQKLSPDSQIEPGPKRKPDGRSRSRQAFEDAELERAGI